MSGMLFVGNFFLFLPNAEDIQPVKVSFKDHEIRLKTQYTSRDASSQWRERIYLSPTILQRKWLDYTFNERFIPSVHYDNVLPLEMDYHFLREIGEEETVRIRSNDKHYRNLWVYVCNSSGDRVYQKEFKRLTAGTEQSFSFSIDIPGVYTICLSTDEQVFRKASLLYYRNRRVVSGNNVPSDAFRDFHEVLEKKKGDIRLFCVSCKSPCFPASPFSTTHYIHKNYIPVKEYLDLEHIGMDRISRYIMEMDHPLSFKRGLVHLLNMLRLASIEDEITIVTNLFKDDPAFIDQQDAIAQFFSLIHIVRGHNNSCAFSFFLKQQVFNHLSVDRIQGAERFIHDNQFISNDLFASSGRQVNMTVRVEENVFELSRDFPPTREREDFRWIGDLLESQIKEANKLITE